MAAVALILPTNYFINHPHASVHMRRRDPSTSLHTPYIPSPLNETKEFRSIQLHYTAILLCSPLFVYLNARCCGWKCDVEPLHSICSSVASSCESPTLTGLSSEEWLLFVVRQWIQFIYLYLCSTRREKWWRWRSQSKITIDGADAIEYYYRPQNLIS